MEKKRLKKPAAKKEKKEEKEEDDTEDPTYVPPEKEEDEVPPAIKVPRDEITRFSNGLFKSWGNIKTDVAVARVLRALDLNEKCTLRAKCKSICDQRTIQRLALLVNKSSKRCDFVIDNYVKRGNIVYIQHFGNFTKNILGVRDHNVINT